MRPVETNPQPSNMAEQAQRRAPLGQPQETPKDDSQQFEELRHLIVAPEQEGIAEISHRLDNLERRAEDVSSVVVEAIELRRQQDTDGALAAALGPTIEDTLRDSVRKHPHILADALFPVMGPAIRKSITETLRSMLESFNEALEHSLSWRGIKWRIEAVRTGKSFAEIVVMHSLLYQVEEVFLIHRETGLVLNHLTDPSLPEKDADMLAGMLSAIQQLSHDRFNTAEGDAIQKWEMPELDGWLEVGPRAVIAVVIRGHAPADYRLRMKKALEEIHERYGAALERFEGDAGPFRAAESILAPLLEKQLREDEPARVKKRPYALMTAAAVALAAVILWIAYVSVRVHQWSQFEEALRQQSGIAVTSISKEGGRYHVRGFRDPLAPDPNTLLARLGWTQEKPIFELAPFYSMDETIVLNRVKVLFKPPPSVTLSLKDGVLMAEGAASPQWIARLHDRAEWIAGVHQLDDAKLQDANALVLKDAKKSVESSVFLFPLGSSTLLPGQDQKFVQAEKNIREIVAQAIALNEIVQIEVVGHTDNTGVEATNLPLSKQRADQVTLALIRGGVKPSSFRPRGVGTLQPVRADDTDEGRQLNRSVTFQVDISPVTP
jgi:outer membrane protein OmpA-like peptidoglycan-associated protein